MKTIEVWRKARRSGQNGNCVELSNRGRIRDSKNPDGPTLDVGQEAVDALVRSARAGRLNG